MKKLIFYPVLTLFSLFLIALIGILGVLFFKPEWIINQKSIEWAIGKQKVLQEVSWNQLDLNIDWKKWNDRHIYGELDSFCFKFENESILTEACFEKITWDFHLVYDFPVSFKALDIQPIKIVSNFIKIKPKENKVKEAPEPFSEIDVWSYYKMAFHPLIPNLDIDLKSIELLLDKNLIFDFKLSKTKKSLKAESFNFKLVATENEFTLSAPKKYALPIDPVMGNTLYLNDFVLNGKISDRKLDIEILGLFESIQVSLNSSIALPIVNDPMKAKWRKEFVSNFEGSLKLEHLNQTYKKYSLEKYSSLPAPLNVMEGDLLITINGETHQDEKFARLLVNGDIDLKSSDQALDLSLKGDIPINVISLSPASIGVEVAFNKVALKLPRLSKTSLPPQFIPDARISKKPLDENLIKEEKKTSLDLNLDLEAMGNKALHLSSNLLDEDLRLNFSFKIRKGKLEKGFVSVLPLNTSVFRRPIEVQTVKVYLNPPLEPVVDAKIKFPLPTYKVTLELEGPVSNPRYAFTSEPPLPQSDIFAVLLFGRPISELSPDDKTSAQRTNQILSQGIFSLGVLYFLAGSPVEYIGYDSESNNATASFGLSSKTSLRVQGSGEGVNSTGVRRSLGKGWYIDTSVEKSKLNNNDSKSYGVMLERILSY